MPWKNLIVLGLRSRFKESRRLKRSQLKPLLGGPSVLAPGPYVMNQRGLFRHLLSRRVPRSLMASRGEKRLVGVRKSLRGLIQRAIYYFTPPIWVWVPRRARINGDIPICALGATTAQGNAVYFSQDLRFVIRSEQPNAVDVTKRQVRVALERHLRLSAVRAVEGTGLTVEPFIDGDAFGSLPVETRAAVFEDLCRRYTELVNVEGGPGLPEYMSKVPAIKPISDSLRPVRLTTIPYGPADTPSPATLPLHRSMIPSHGDLTTGNLLYADGIVTLIDLEDCAILPFFYDLFNLALSEAERERYDLVAALATGRFDYAVRPLWAAAGCTFDAHTVESTFADTVAIYLHRWGVERQIDWRAARASGLPNCTGSFADARRQSM